MILSLSDKNTFNVIRVDPSKFQDLPVLKRLGIQAYFRLQLTELLPLSIDELLYLDSDLIVQKDITKLFPINIEPPMMAIIDGATKSQQERRKLNHPYFNSGVMLIPLEYWREENISAKILQRTYPDITLADQDILNDYFNGQWKALDTRLNVKGFDPKYMTYGSWQKEHEEAYIIHYMDVWKPWTRIFRSGFPYWKYLLKTPYKRASIQFLYAFGKTLKQNLAQSLSHKKAPSKT